MSRKNLMSQPDVGPPLLMRQIRIPSAAVLTLNATPVELVPSPGGATQAAYGSETTGNNKGPTKAILFERAIVNVVGGSTNYDDTGDGLRVQYSGGGTAVSFVFTDVLNAAGAGTVFCMERVGTDLAIQATGVLTPNAGLELTQTTAEVTTGDRDLLVTVLYRIVELEGN